jgi:hypothetical protein
MNPFEAARNSKEDLERERRGCTLTLRSQELMSRKKCRRKTKRKMESARQTAREDAVAAHTHESCARGAAATQASAARRRRCLTVSIGVTLVVTGTAEIEQQTGCEDRGLGDAPHTHSGTGCGVQPLRKNFNRKTATSNPRSLGIMSRMRACLDCDDVIKY